MTIEITPEEEKLIHEKLRSGVFQSVDELIHRASIALPTPEPPVQKSGKHLVDLLSEPPFAGSELNLQRQKGYPRQIES
jgi:hypothetical protein